MLTIVFLTGSTFYEILTLPAIVMDLEPSTANLCEVQAHV